MPFEEDIAENNGGTSLGNGATVSSHGYGTGLLRITTLENGVYKGIVVDADKKYHGVVQDLIGSHLGHQFDSYVREVLQEPAAYAAQGPATKEYPRLWPGRRLKLLLAKNATEWTIGRIANMKQYCARPLSPSTLWYMKIDLEQSKSDVDCLKPGRLVELHGLDNAKEHNGKYGVIMAPMNSDGRYKVQIPGPDVTLGIKGINLKAVTTLEREIGRANVHVGGTLIGESYDFARKISFQWLDPPNPNPEWKPKICSLEELSYQLQGQYSGPEYQARKKQYQDEFAKVAPSYRGSIGLPEAPDAAPRQERFDRHVKKEVEPKLVKLMEMAEGGNTKPFEEFLMTEPFLLFQNCSISKDIAMKFTRTFNLAKLRVAVLKERKTRGDFVEMTHWICDHCKCFPLQHGRQFNSSEEMNEDYDYDYVFHRWLRDSAQAIGEAYENSKEYDKAIPWYLEALEAAKKGYSGEHDMLASSFHDIAVAYQNMGFLGRAYEMYCFGVRADPESESIREAYDILTKEINLWVGTCGFFLSEDSSLQIGENGELLAQVVQPHPLVPEHYGDWTGKSKWQPIPLDLPRSLSLRRLPAALSNFDKLHAETLYRQIYDGSFGVEIAGHDVDGDGRNNALYLRIFTLWPHQEIFQAVHAVAKGRGTQVLRFVTSVFLEPYTRWFTKDQKRTLGYRVIHWALRSSGVYLNGENANAPKVADTLYDEYIKTKSWREALDAAIIKADFVRKQPNGTTLLGPCLNSIGEALESLGKFQRAATLYAEAAALVMEAEQYCTASTLYSNSGLAYRRLLDHENSEKQNFSAMHALCAGMGGTFNVNADAFESLITNFVVNYQLWLAQMMGAQNEEIQMGHEIQVVYSMFICLLNGAGFTPKRPGKTKDAVLKDARKLKGSALRRSFKTTAQCKKRLDDIAMESPDILAFRRGILECGDPRFIPFALRDRGAPAISAEQRLREAKVESKAEAREYSTRHSPEGYVSSLEHCDNPNCSAMTELNKCHLCICEKVSYCSAKCRKIHWKNEHKKTCPTKAENGAKAEADSLNEYFCYNCLRTQEGAAPENCPCGEVQYCSVVCKEAHWSTEHQEQCSSACSACRKKEEDIGVLLNCPCYTVQYCSKECQKRDWRQHKQVCSSRQKK